MGWRIRKSKKIGPVRLTLSNKGVSYSVGGKGVRYTVRADGKKQVTYGIPGTGVYNTQVLDDSGETKKRIPASVSSGNYDYSQPSSEQLDSSELLAKLRLLDKNKENLIGIAKITAILCILGSPFILILCIIPILNSILGFIVFIIVVFFYQALNDINNKREALIQNLDGEDYYDYLEQQGSRNNTHNQENANQDDYEYLDLDHLDKSVSSDDLLDLINQAEEQLVETKASFGENHEAVADIMDAYAKLLKTAKTRPLDAANMEARAKVIRAISAQQIPQTSEPLTPEKIESLPIESKPETLVINAQAKEPEIAPSPKVDSTCWSCHSPMNPDSKYCENCGNPVL